MSADKKGGIARDTDSINGNVVGDIDVARASWERFRIRGR